MTDQPPEKPKAKRGFQLMTPEKRREIAARGGKKTQFKSKTEGIKTGFQRLPKAERVRLARKGGKNSQASFGYRLNEFESAIGRSVAVVKKFTVEDLLDLNKMTAFLRRDKDREKSWSLQDAISAGQSDEITERHEEHIKRVIYGT